MCLGVVFGLRTVQLLFGESCDLLRWYFSKSSVAVLLVTFWWIFGTHRLSEVGPFKLWLFFDAFRRITSFLHQAGLQWVMIETTRPDTKAYLAQNYPFKSMKWFILTPLKTLFIERFCCDEPLLTLLTMGCLRVFSCSHTRMKTTDENTLLEHSTSILEGVRVNKMKP